MIISKQSGEIAKHLDLVNHNVRTQLDEIKRREIDRLLELRRLQMKQMQGMEMLHYIAYHGGMPHKISFVFYLQPATFVYSPPSCFTHDTLALVSYSG